MHSVRSENAMTGLLRQGMFKLGKTFVFYDKGWTEGLLAFCNQEFELTQYELAAFTLLCTFNFLYTLYTKISKMHEGSAFGP